MADEPTIPVAPTEPTTPTDPVETPPLDEDVQADSDEGPEAKNKGGRRSNKDLVAHNKDLLAENRKLRRALSMFAAIPDDPTKPDNAVLYVLSRGGESTDIRCSDLREARRLVLDF